jgi:hypothetical protein
LKSLATAQFWVLYGALPEDVRKAANETYVRWREDPFHLGLAFKRVHPRLPLWSVRIGARWRAVGKREGDTITWFWIGSHAEYDKLLRRR